MIEPEIEEVDGKVSLFIDENVIDKPIKKRKRRWIYYGLCVLISFVVSRIVLIIFSVLNFDIRDYALAQFSYSTEKAKSIYLEARHCKAFSPLNVQILEGVVSFYSDSNNSKTRELMAELHIPNINVEKYKTLQFKGNVVWKNIRPSVIYKFFKYKKNISIFFTGNIWFRFCYIKFWKSHSDEVKWSSPLANESDKSNSYPLHIKRFDFKNLLDIIQCDMELELSNLKIPTYINVQSDDVSFNFTGDIPFKVFILNQEIRNGKIVNPIVIRFVVQKSDFFNYRYALWKYLNEKSFHWMLNSIDIYKDSKKINKSYDLSIGDIMHLDKTNKDKKANQRKSPLCTFRDIKTHKNSIVGFLDIDISLFPYISRSTCFSYIDIQKTFCVKNELVSLMVLHTTFINSNEFLRIQWECNFLDFSTFMNDLLFKRHSLYLYDINTTGLFKGMSLKWDGRLLTCNTERNYFILYKAGKNTTPFKFVGKMDHHIDSFENTLLLCSSMFFEDKLQSESPYIQIIVPRIGFNVNCKNFNAKIAIPDTEYIFSQKEIIKGVFRSEIEVICKDELYHIDSITSPRQTLYEIAFNEYFKFIYPEEKKDKEKNKNKQSSLIFNLQELIIDIEEILSLNPPKLGISLKNPSSFQADNNNVFIHNKITITPGPFIRLVFSGSKCVNEEHIQLLEECNFDIYFIDGKFYMALNECKIGVSLFSLQEFRTLFLDKITFGISTNALGNIVGVCLNDLLSKNGDTSSLSNAVCAVECNVDSEGFSDDMMTTMNLKISLTDDIIKTCKFKQINIIPITMEYYQQVSFKRLATIQMYTIKENNIYSFIVKVNYIRSLFNESSSGKLVVYTPSIDIPDSIKNYEMPLQNIQLLKLVRSFFVSLWAKDKKEANKESVLPNISIDMSNSLFDFSSELTIKDVFLKVESYGIRDLIRYKFGLLIAKFFSSVPSILFLEIKANRIDLFACDLEDKYIKNAPHYFMTSLLNVNCSYYFPVHNDGDKIKPDEMKYISEKIKPDNNIENTFSGVNKFEDAYPFLVNMEQLVYGISNAYALKFKFNVEIVNFQTKKLPFKGISTRLSFTDSIFELIRDDSNTENSNINNFPMCLSVFSTKFYLGINLLIKFPENLEYEFQNEKLINSSGKLPQLKTVNGYLNIDHTDYISIMINFVYNIKSLIDIEKEFHIRLLYNKQVEVDYMVDKELISYYAFDKTKEYVVKNGSYLFTTIKSFIIRCHKFFFSKSKSVPESENEKNITVAK